MINRDNSDYYDLASKISHLVQCVTRGDEAGAYQSSFEAKKIHDEMDQLDSYSKFQMNLVFIDFLNLVTDTSTDNSLKVMTCISFFRDIYGPMSLIVSDLCE